jgi:hypothetical protein
MTKVKRCEVVSIEEWYDVTVENDNGEEVSYSIHYQKDTNTGWDTFEVLDDNGNDVPEGELRDKIIDAFETCDKEPV